MWRKETLKKAIQSRPQSQAKIASVPQGLGREKLRGSKDGDVWTGTVSLQTVPNPKSCATAGLHAPLRFIKASRTTKQSCQGKINTWQRDNGWEIFRYDSSSTSLTVFSFAFNNLVAFIA